MEKKDVEMKKADDTTKDDKWTTVNDPSFVRFDNLSDSLEGRLLDKEISERWGFGLYTIIDANKDSKRFHGTQQLDDLMKQITEGSYIRVTLIDTKNMPQGTMKIFTVDVKDEE